MKTKHISFNTYAREEDLRKVVNSKSDLLRFACFITHDRDVWNESDERKNSEHKAGISKETHRHLLLWLKSEREPRDICNWFKKCLDDKGEIANTRYEETRSTSNMYEYLTHNTEDAKSQGKYQYISEDIKVLYGSADEYIESVTMYEERCRKSDELKEKAESKRIANEESIDNMLNDIIDGKPMRYMAKAYGRDYIKNRKAYHDFAGDVYFEESGDFDGAFLIASVGSAFDSKAMNKALRDGVSYGFERAITVLAESEDNGNRLTSEQMRFLLNEMKRSIKD